MYVPTQMKRRALNIACVSKWKRASCGELRPKAIIITPSWLKVEYATIFFMSISSKAVRAAMSIVSALTIRRVGEKRGIC